MTAGTRGSMRGNPSFSTKGDDMAAEMPVAELHAGFSSPGATPTDWAEGRRHIDEAEVSGSRPCVPMNAHTSPPVGRVARGRDLLLHRSGRAQGKEPGAEPTVYSHHGPEPTRWSRCRGRRTRRRGQRHSGARAISHVALETDGEIQVFDVWESREAFEAFG
jgi:hypothetical protein